jgi:hypothetical protein
MTNQDLGKLEIAAPGEWALKKILGPVFAEIGDDLKRLYVTGRDKLLEVSIRKIDDIDDGRVANLRVARDVLLSGPFAEGDVCAEYFGGALASSRSVDGVDDSCVPFVAVIKSLAASQLRLHYIVYSTLQRLLNRHQPRLNVGNSSEIHEASFYMTGVDIQFDHSIPYDVDLNILWQNGLLHSYEARIEQSGKMILPWIMVRPSTFGVMLYAAAHNRMDAWKDYAQSDFGSLEGIARPVCYATDLASLKSMTGLLPPEHNDDRERFEEGRN